MPMFSLWLPVLVSAVIVFVVSSVLHMVLKYHRADYKALPNEDAVREVLGKGAIPPGLYQLPYCSDAKSMQDPAFKAKFEKGPVGVITIIPNGLPAMGKYLAQWFVFTVLISAIAAFAARQSLQPLRVAGIVAFTGYGLTNVLDSIWKGQPWANTGRSLVDGAIYALATGLTFCWLWPKL